MIRKICLLAIIGLISLILGCGGNTLTGDVIKAEKTKKDPKIACMQNIILKQTIFKDTFKYDDSYPPTLYVYIEGEWNTLDYEMKEITLTAIGKAWHVCNPDNMAVLTVMAYDSNDLPVLAVFVSKGD